MGLLPSMPSAPRGAVQGTGRGQPALRARPPLLLEAGVVVLLVLLQARTAGADNCAVQRQVCESIGGHLCGFDIGATGCLYQCCNSQNNLCCGPLDQNGVPFAQCCGITPDYTGTCQLDCTDTCNRPCGVGCCRVSRDEVCTNPSVAECCPQQNVCRGTSSLSCCEAPKVCTAEGTCCLPGQVGCKGRCCPAPEVCTPEGTCCLPGEVGCQGQCCPAGSACDRFGTCCQADKMCGQECCPQSNCCNGQCCQVGFSCYRDRVCCDRAALACGDVCCDTNEKCVKKPKRKICKCRKKGKERCAGTRCCAGDICIEGVCVAPLR